MLVEGDIFAFVQAGFLKTELAQGVVQTLGTGVVDGKFEKICIGKFRSGRRREQFGWHRGIWFQTAGDLFFQIQQRTDGVGSGRDARRGAEFVVEDFQR